MKNLVTAIYHLSLKLQLNFSIRPYGIVTVSIQSWCSIVIVAYFYRVSITRPFSVGQQCNDLLRPTTYNGNCMGKLIHIDDARRVCNACETHAQHV